MNKQINLELFSAYLYFAMESYFKASSMDGFANWMNAQAQEEISHAMKLFNFMHDRGETVELDAIEKPMQTWESPLAAFEDSLAHEKVVTASINELVTKAMAVNDHATVIFLQWFVSEQIEEEANVGTVVDQIKMVGKSLFMLDRELGQRVFTAPATEE